MKRNLLPLLVFFLGAVFQTLSAQVAPTESTEDNPVWYYIESVAATTISDAYTGPMPLKGNDYVMYSPSAAGQAAFRVKTGADDEKWAIVDIAGTRYLKNKGTGMYLNSAHSVGGAASDEYFYESLGADNQYVMYNATSDFRSTGGNYSLTLAWNGNTINRWGMIDSPLNSQIAWYFKEASIPTSTDVSTTSMIKVISENGQIVVFGTNSDYKVFNISGNEVSTKSKLKAGIYIVRIEDQTFKVLVK